MRLDDDDDDENAATDVVDINSINMERIILAEKFILLYEYAMYNISIPIYVKTVLWC